MKNWSPAEDMIFARYVGGPRWALCLVDIFTAGNLIWEICKALWRAVTLRRTGSL